MRIPPSSVRTPPTTAGMARHASASGAPRLPDPGTEVRLSTAARTLSEARGSAEYDPIRPDVVRQIRADLAAGRVGTPADIAATVDALIQEL